MLLALSSGGRLRFFFFEIGQNWYTKNYTIQKELRAVEDAINKKPSRPRWLFDCSKIKRAPGESASFSANKFHAFRD